MLGAAVVEGAEQPVTVQPLQAQRPSGSLRRELVDADRGEFLQVVVDLGGAARPGPTAGHG